MSLSPGTRLGPYIENRVRWDAAPGGQRFLVSVDVEETKDSPMVLVTDWVKTLGR